MDFKELLIKRRSIRKYAEKPVSLETLRGLISTGILAPSAGNEQPWEFIIINDKTLLAEISEDCKANLLNRINNNPDDYANRYRHMFENPKLNIFYNAPALIIILGNVSVKNLSLDCTLAASYLMFDAASKGLGTCWINFALEMSDSIKQKIGVPDGYKMIAPIIVGYPEMIPQAPLRKQAKILKITRLDIHNEN